ncbi:MAG: SBBP repeat-containing protein [Methanomassiliicoccales archaeon]|nr:MAG: SBBP repeat-containing protein [Methanomassiliicoccales archaeon]
MRSKIISCVICTLMIATILVVEVPKDVSAQVTEEWIARYDGSGSTDEAYLLALDSFGNVYIGGSSYGIGTNMDYAVVKYDPAGNQLWNVRFNGEDNGPDSPIDMVVDLSDNVYITGTIWDDDTYYDWATVKYDSNGNEQWKIIHSSDEFNKASAMVINSLGNIIVTGNIATAAYDTEGNILWTANNELISNSYVFPNDIDCDDSGNVYITGSTWDPVSDHDFATIAYSPSGDKLWSATYNGPGNNFDGNCRIAVDESGNVYITGESVGIFGFTYDYATIKYDYNGNEIWINRYDDPSHGSDFPQDIELDSYGNVYVTGTSWNSTTYVDYATIKYDSAGNEIWVSRYSDIAECNDLGIALAIDHSGRVYVTGASESDPHGPYIPEGYYGYVTISYDSLGKELWVTRYEGPNEYQDMAMAIALDEFGNVYVTGSSFGNNGGMDFCTIKYVHHYDLIRATIDIDPDTLNLKSKGRWITCYITLNEPYNVNDIEIDTILLEDTIPAEWGDIQGDTLIVKFDRSDVEDMLSPGAYNLKVTGELTDGTLFGGFSDEIRVIDPP